MEKNKINRESVVALHTHTHTHTDSLLKEEKTGGDV